MLVMSDNQLQDIIKKEMIDDVHNFKNLDAVKNFYDTIICDYLKSAIEASISGSDSVVIDLNDEVRSLILENYCDTANEYIRELVNDSFASIAEAKRKILNHSYLSESFRRD